LSRSYTFRGAVAGEDNCSVWPDEVTTVPALRDPLPRSAPTIETEDNNLNVHSRIRNKPVS
jgi:hypothetical protein